MRDLPQGAQEAEHLYLCLDFQWTFQQTPQGSATAPLYPDQPPESTTSFPSWNSARTAILVPGGWSAPWAESSLPTQHPDFWSPNIPFSRQEKPADQSRSGSCTQCKHAPALQGPQPPRQTDRQTDTHTHTHTHRAISEQNITWFGCNMPINGCPGEETIETGAQGGLDKSPQPTAHAPWHPGTYPAHSSRDPGTPGCCSCQPARPFPLPEEGAEQP